MRVGAWIRGRAGARPLWSSRTARRGSLDGCTYRHHGEGRLPPGARRQGYSIPGCGNNRAVLDDMSRRPAEDVVRGRTDDVPAERDQDSADGGQIREGRGRIAGPAIGSGLRPAGPRAARARSAP